MKNYRIGLAAVIGLVSLYLLGNALIHPMGLEYGTAGVLGIGAALMIWHKTAKA